MNTMMKMKSKALVGQVLKPGQRGTQKWSREYGEQLVTVRYRYDRETRMRHTTVELVVESFPWEPPAQKLDLPKSFYIEVRFEEEELRKKVRNAGGQWDAEKRRWLLPLAVIKALGLESRIDKSASGH